MQKQFDYVGVTETLTNHDNPEIWHADNLSHPGLVWSVKTVIPKPEFADNDTVDLIQLYHKIAETRYNFVKITPEAFNWNGDRLEEWDTVWIKRGWDIEFADENGTLTYNICSYTKTSTDIAKSLIDSIGKQLAKLDTIEEREELLDMLEACEIMSSMTSDYESKKLRSNFRVIDD
jgi:hypothetical protein